MYVRTVSSLQRGRRYSLAKPGSLGLAVDLLGDACAI